METSKVDVLAWLHTSEESKLISEATGRIAFDPRTTEPALVIEDETGSFDESYRFSRIPFQDLNDCSPEIDQAVKFAVGGYNACVVLLSAGSADAFETRRDTLRKILNELDRQIALSNETRQRRQQPILQLEYAYLGITDDCCYDLRKGARLDNSYLLERGIDSLMKVAKNAEIIWDKAKEGCKFPFALKIRITDNIKFVGSLILADLLFPWYTLPRGGIPPSLKYSFASLNELVRRASDSDYVGSVSTETCVLTQILGPSFMGLSKLTVFMYLDEYPGGSINEVKDALDFSQQLQRIRTILARNEPDPRLSYYEERYLTVAEELEKEKEKAISASRDIAELAAKLEAISSERQFERRILQESKKENQKLQVHCDLIQAVAEYNAGQNRLEQCILKNINYELRLSRVRMDRKYYHAANNIKSLESEIDELRHNSANTHSDSMRQMQRLKEQLEVCEKQLRQKEADLRDARQELARQQNNKTFEEENKRLKEDMESLLKIVQILENEKDKSARMINSLAEKTSHLEEERSKWRRTAQERETDMLDCMADIRHAESRIKEYENEIAELKGKLREYEASSSRSRRTRASDEVDDLGQDQPDSSDIGLKPSSQQNKPTEPKVPKKRGRPRKQTETVTSTIPESTKEPANDQEPVPADSSSAGNIPVPADAETQAKITETAAPQTVKKRRKLLDPKRRVQEYDDPLSPLSKVEQVLRDDS